MPFDGFIIATLIVLTVGFLAYRKGRQDGETTDAPDSGGGTVSDGPDGRAPIRE